MGREARKYIVEGRYLTISEISRIYCVEEKYLYLLSKKCNYKEDCIEKYLKRNNHMEEQTITIYG